LARPPDTLSSKRGKNRIRKQGTKILTRSLKMADKIYELANNLPGDTPILEQLNIVQMAFKNYAEYLPYLMPKQAAIAPAELDSEGDLVAPAKLREMYEKLREIEGVAEEDFHKGVIPQLVEGKTE